MRRWMVVAAALSVTGCGSDGSLPGRDGRLVQLEMVDPDHYDMPDGLSDPGMFPGRFRWKGAPSELVRMVAARVGYDYAERGPVAKLPDVQLELRDPMAVHILATASRRLGDDGTVVIDTAERRVVLDAGRP